MKYWNVLFILIKIFKNENLGKIGKLYWICNRVILKVHKPMVFLRICRKWIVVAYLCAYIVYIIYYCMIIGDGTNDTWQTAQYCTSCLTDDSLSSWTCFCSVLETLAASIIVLLYQIITTNLSKSVHGSMSSQGNVREK